MSNYWSERVKREEAQTHAKALEVIKELERVYKRAFENIKNSINELEIQIKSNEQEMDMLEALKVLSPKDRKALDSKVKDTLEYYTELAKSIDYKEVKKRKAVEVYRLKILENLGYKSRLTRLEATKLEIAAELEALARQKEMIILQHLEKVYEDTYYKTAHIEATETGVGKYINKLDKPTITKAVKKSWVSDGKNFSDRIWNNTNKLAEDVSKGISIDIATGKSNLARDLKKKYNVTMAQANRLVQTETSAIRNQATMDRYVDSGIEQYQILATLDTRTSSVCRSMDLKIFNVKDKEIGVNYPPFHINCRSTTKAYIEELEKLRKGKGTRKARLPNGEEQDVPSDMKYEDWYNKFVKSNPEQLKYEKMDKNRASDMQQYLKYKETFKNNGVPKEYIPKDVDSFAKLKYNIIDSNGQQDYNIFKARHKILTTDWEIHDGKQGKHILGHNNYQSGSYFKNGIDISKLAKENLGRGEFKMDVKGNWTNKEFITVNKNIGYDVDKITKIHTETNRFSIHYDSKNKIHLVPRK